MAGNQACESTQAVNIRSDTKALKLDTFVYELQRIFVLLYLIYTT